jgi:hypothetical protein
MVYRGGSPDGIAQVAAYDSSIVLCKEGCNDCGMVLGSLRVIERINWYRLPCVFRTASSDQERGD